MPIFCKKHGLHTKWRLHTGNNVKCKLCACEIEKKSKLKYPLRRLLRHAKSRKRGYNLDEPYLKGILKKQENRCALTGIKFTKDLRPSLDRIDSKRGYFKGNVQLVLLEVNIMKSNFKQSRLIELCRLISKHKK
jgi:hypothetical protein